MKAVHEIKQQRQRNQKNDYVDTDLVGLHEFYVWMTGNRACMLTVESAAAPQSNNVPLFSTCVLRSSYRNEE
jgi:hypothetical protein